MSFTTAVEQPEGEVFTLPPSNKTTTACFEGWPDAPPGWEVFEWELVIEHWSPVRDNNGDFSHYVINTVSRVEEVPGCYGGNWVGDRAQARAKVIAWPLDSESWVDDEGEFVEFVESGWSNWVQQDPANRLDFLPEPGVVGLFCCLIVLAIIGKFSKRVKR